MNWINWMWLSHLTHPLLRRTLQLHITSRCHSFLGSRKHIFHQEALCISVLLFLPFQMLQGNICTYKSKFMLFIHWNKHYRLSQMRSIALQGHFPLYIKAMIFAVVISLSLPCYINFPNWKWNGNKNEIATFFEKYKKHFCKSPTKRYEHGIVMTSPPPTSSAAPKWFRWHICNLYIQLASMLLSWSHCGDSSFKIRQQRIIDVYIKCLFASKNTFKFVLCSLMLLSKS